MQDTKQEQTEILARLEVVRQEQGAWELASFGRQPIECPIWGCIEELGELSHTALKFRQRIRNVDDVKFLADGRDALADIAIYLFSFANKAEVAPLPILASVPSYSTPLGYVINTNLPRDNFDPRKAVECQGFANAHRELTKSISNLYAIYDFSSVVDMANIAVRHTLRALSDLAVIGFGSRIENLVEATWEQAVSKRNWKTNPSGENAPNHSEIVHA